MPIHGCDPTTVRHGDFCLLDFSPGPVRLSLDDLEVQDSSRIPISMPDLALTPGRHGTLDSREPRPQTIHQLMPPGSWITGARHNSQRYQEIN